MSRQNIRRDAYAVYTPTNDAEGLFLPTLETPVLRGDHVRKLYAPVFIWKKSRGKQYNSPGGHLSNGATACIEQLLFKKMWRDRTDP